jgi:uncharacterized protein YbaP (TraB family)
MHPISRFMPKSLLATCLFVLLSGSTQAQAPMAQPQAMPVQDIVFVPPKDPPVPLLWKVSDADNAVYLLGSFHLLKPDDYPLSTDVNDAFADAKQVVFELPPEEMSSPQLGLQMMQAALRADGTRLDSELPPATLLKFKAWEAANADALQKLGVTPDRLQLFEPWYVGLLVSVTEMTKQGLDPALGLDQHFMAASESVHKPTSGFETGAEQIAFLDGMNHEEQLQFFDEALSQADEGEQELDQLHTAWRNGDEATIREGMAVDMRNRYPRLYQRINVDRNDAWIPKIERMLATPGTDDTLVVVGALHLLGSDGVVEKLRAKGYSVERVCSACLPDLHLAPARQPDTGRP